LVIAAFPAGAQDFSALARMDVAQSGAVDRMRSVDVNVLLSQPVPYRVFTLDDPCRLVLDFCEVDFRVVEPAAFTQSDWVYGARFGALRPGWNRMILDLSDPVRVDAAGMTVNDVDGTAAIRVVLRSRSEADFTAAAGAPDDPAWAFETTSVTAPPPDDGPLVMVIDPGHGGIDPGA
jgi:N-acetylmuramoyl-L-alanine amidase